MSESTLAQLKDYPFATVRFACIRCDRQGMHLKNKLITEHGPEADLLELRRLVAGCGIGHGRPCGAYYPDLAKG
jgi:hypothetical protein